MSGVPEDQKFRDGKVVLYKRERSNKWQVRFKTSIGRWQRLSTNESNLKKAGEIACDVYDEARYRTKFELPETTRRFDRVANLAIRSMQEELDAGLGKSVYATYIAVIKLHLIPYFGSKFIDNIKPAEYKEFYDAQQDKSSKLLTRSTITNYNSALNRIFDTALANGWLNKTQVPVLRNRGSGSDRRPAFTPDEYMVMTNKLITWSTGGSTERSKMIRRLLRDYVLILANTGMRPGTESDNLKWKHIEWIRENGKNKYLKLHVNGKTGHRELIARHNCVDYFGRIQQRFPDLSSMTFDELIKAKVDDYVFRLENGERTRLNQNFEQFLQENGLLKDNITGQNRVLYSLRHTYATFALTVHNSSIYDLAMQMGTSVAMIEKHYSHLTPTMKAKSLAGKKFD